MSERIEIHDWTDATRPMRSAVHEALHRLRETIAAASRKTQPSLMTHVVFDDVDDLHTEIEQALDDLQA